MSPKRILASALEKNIDIIGICDHNSTSNSEAVIKAAKGKNIRVIPGMEVTSEEEVHVLALFDDMESAMKLQEQIHANLPGKNDQEAFGMQVLVNEEEEVLGFDDHLLIGATTTPLEHIVRLIHSLDGLAIASHIDREAFSLVGQLGFIPDEVELDALEISPRMSFQQADKKYRTSFPLITSSDAHDPGDIGKSFTTFLLEEASLTEIKKALNNENGRRLIH